MQEILVSIICPAYNHEKYIRKCLEGFVMQKTDFAFEVLINDDCSTDNTAKIIKEYEKKYPNIIKPIYQAVNQYSQGVDITKDILLPKVKGKYIASCEGDDFWIDENKLQIQVDYLEKNYDCMCVTHASKIVNNLNYTSKNYYPAYKERDFTIEEIIRGGGGLFSTNSIMIRKEMQTEMPKCFYAKSFGDYQIPLYSGIIGKVHYLPEVMSVYNYLVPNSWSSQNIKNRQKAIDATLDMIGLLENINIYYNLKYNDIFSEEIIKYKNCLLLAQEKYKDIKENREYYNSLNRKDKFKVRLGSFSPFLLKIVLKINNGIKNIRTLNARRKVKRKDD